MPKIHRHRGVTTEVPIPSDPGVVDAEPLEVLTDTPDDTEPVTEPGEPVDAVVVDKHGDDAAAVADVPADAPADAPAPAARKRAR